MTAGNTALTSSTTTPTDTLVSALRDAHALFPCTARNSVSMAVAITVAAAAVMAVADCSGPAPLVIVPVGIASASVSPAGCVILF